MATLVNEMLRDLSRTRATAVAYIQALEERPAAAGTWTRLTFSMAGAKPPGCGVPPAAQLLAQVTWIFDCLSTTLGTYAEQPQADENLVAKVETLLAAEGEMQTAAVKLLRVEAQVCRADSAPTPTTCTPALAALTTLPVGRWSSAARWDKVQVQELEIAATSPFEESVVPRLGEVTPKIRIRWVYADLFGFGVGITHTHLASPTFSAVGADDAGKVVTNTGESSRSGKLALFVNYSFLSHLRPSTSASFSGRDSNWAPGWTTRRRRPSRDSPCLSGARRVWGETGTRSELAMGRW